MNSNIQVPVAVSGKVSRLSGVSFCMDAATHLISGVLGAHRVSAQNAEIGKALDAAVANGTHVLAMGYPHWGPECSYVAVYHLAEVDQVRKALEGGIDTWPWKVLATV